MTCTRPERRPDEAARRACAVVRRVRDDRQDQEAWARAQHCRAVPRSRTRRQRRTHREQDRWWQRVRAQDRAIAFDTPAVAVTLAHGHRGEPNTAGHCRTTDDRREIWACLSLNLVSGR